MTKLRITAQGNIVQFLEAELAKLESLTQALEGLEPFTAEFGSGNTKEAQVEGLFPAKPSRKNYQTNEEFMAAEDTYMETPEGQAYYTAYLLDWDVSLLDTVQETKEEVGQMIYKIRQTIATLAQLS